MIYELASIIAIPYIIRFFNSYVLRSKVHKTPHNTSTFGHKSFISSEKLWILLFIIYCIISLIYSKPANIFDDLALPYDAPSFRLRNRFREYCENRLFADQHFNEVTSNFRPIRQKSSSDAQKGDPSDFVSEYEWLSELFYLLKNSSNRFIYLVYGQDTFVLCNWCKSESEYLLFSLPALFSQYLVAGFVFGVYSSTSGSLYLRKYVALYLISVFSLDASFRLLPKEYMDLLVHELKELMNLNYRMFQFRILAFVAIGIAILCADRKSKTLSEHILSLLKRQKYNYLTTKSVQLLQLAISEDSEMLEKFLKHRKCRKVIRNSTSNDNDVITLRAQLRVHPFPQKR